MFLTLVSGCGREEAEILNRDISFFPLQTGLFQVYNVEEKRYRLALDPVESQYQVMIHIVDSFPSRPGIFTYVVHRSERADASDVWTHTDTWSVRNEQGAVVVAEGNTAFVKLRLPLASGNRWDANIYNTLGEDEYTALDVNEPFEVNGTIFDRTVTIEQEYNDDVIVYRDERKEVYAKDVGLVYKELTQLDYCTADYCLGLQKVNGGVELKMTIVEHGMHKVL